MKHFALALSMACLAAAKSMHAAAPGATVVASSSTSRPTSGRQDGERPMRWGLARPS